MATNKIRITETELEYVEYCIKGLMQEIATDSIDMGYINEKLSSIKATALRVRQAQEKAFLTNTIFTELVY